MWEDLKNPFLKLFLDYVEDTETPRIMHIWAALTSAGACLGRRCFIPFGINDVYPNLFVLLVGPPAVRKGAPLKVLQKMIKKTTNIRFAPRDTGGQRQGLIVAMEGNTHQVDADALKELEAALDIIDLEKLGATPMQINAKDMHVMFAIASELSSLLGQNASSLCTFLNEVYDGIDYDYQIRSTDYVLTDPLLSILGATTPTQIAETLPPSAVGHGFSSRIIFVFANKSYKDVPILSDLPEELGVKLEEIFSDLYYNFNGPINLSQAAKDFTIAIYKKEIPLNDVRFIYYLDRRQAHMLKVSMILAATSGRQIIEVDDVKEADSLLKYTEQFMPDALGEFGMSPIGAAKQKMLEFIQHVNGPVTKNVLWAMMQKDLKQVDFQNALMDMTNAKKIIAVSSKFGEAYVYNDVESDNVVRLVEGE